MQGGYCFNKGRLTIKCISFIVIEKFKSIDGTQFKIRWTIDSSINLSITRVRTCMYRALNSTSYAWLLPIDRGQQSKYLKHRKII